MSITGAKSVSLGVLALGFLWLLERRYKEMVYRDEKSVIFKLTR